MTEVHDTLFVTTDGAYIHVEGEGFKIELPDQPPRRLPRLNFAGLVVIGNVMVSPQTFGRCAEEGRTISLFDMYGRFLARVEGPVTGNVLLRRAQHQAYDDPGRRADLARSIVAGKLQNCRSILQRNARDAPEEDVPAIQQAAEEQAEALRRLEHGKDVDMVLGTEGAAAAAYFKAFAHMLRKNEDTWTFAARQRRPPRDPVNALLSFLYAILTHDVRGACEGVGLDPQVGFLHSLRPGRPALALDLMEELRPIMVDRLVLRLLNLGKLKPSDFTTRKGGAVHIKDDARKTVLVEYQSMKRKQTVEHTATGRKVPYGLLPHLQARLLARVLRGDVKTYIPCLIRG